MESFELRQENSKKVLAEFRLRSLIQMAEEQGFSHFVLTPTEAPGKYGKFFKSREEVSAYQAKIKTGTASTYEVNSNDLYGQLLHRTSEMERKYFIDDQGYLSYENEKPVRSS